MNNAKTCWIPTTLSLLVLIIVWLSGDWVKWVISASAVVILVLSLMGSDYYCYGTRKESTNNSTNPTIPSNETEQTTEDNKQE